jgi:hypothetical protein
MDLNCEAGVLLNVTYRVASICVTGIWVLLSAPPVTFDMPMHMASDRKRMLQSYKSREDNKWNLMQNIRLLF